MQQPIDFTRGDEVRITCGDRVVDGVVVLSSSNSVSLMIQFEAMLDGHVGMMPVLLQDGVYRSIITGIEVGISHLQTGT